MCPKTPDAPHVRLKRKRWMEEYLREEFLYPYPHPKYRPYSYAVKPE
jgi:hypothetical protein